MDNEDMTTITPPVEHQPLLPIGLHRMRLRDLKDLCVSRFPDSATRQVIMEGLECVIQKLVDAAVHVEVWIDGSFLTAKRDPEDADIVLCVPAEVYEKGNQQQRDALEWIMANQKDTHRCDSYFFYVFPDGDQRAVLNDYNYAYWIRQFGFSRGQDLKGIAVLHTGGLS